MSEQVVKEWTRVEQGLFEWTVSQSRRDRLDEIHSRSLNSAADFERFFIDLVDFVEDESVTPYPRSTLGQFGRGKVLLAPHLTIVGESRSLRDLRDREDAARCDIKVAAKRLREAEGAESRRAAAREFLAALATLIAALLAFVVRVLLLLLSRALGRTYAEDVPVWQPEPIDEKPQIAPRGPNSAFPVNIIRGGHRSSAQGSAVLAA
ncbi:hypothetical protein ABT160_46890 [Streptomyces sp. NPDC001941]|uniref:hypothetical protein n=1 Tax=Streptomyces sp. NPDC001941 TaxID=3154659 RepID=UPI00331C51A0